MNSENKNLIYDWNKGVLLMKGVVRIEFDDETCATDFNLLP